MILKPSVILCLTLLLLVGGLISCKTVMPERYAKYNGGRVNVDLPSGTKNADYDIDIDKDTSLVISLPDDSSIFIGKSRSSIPREMLSGKLKEWLKDRTDPDQMVYIAASVSDNYGNVVEVLDEVRKAGVSRAGLIANRLHAEAPSRFVVDVPTEPNPNEFLTSGRPNPLTLIVSVTPDLKLKLNQDDYGSINDPEPLSMKLLEIFKLRTENRAYRPGLETRTDLPESERVEKTLIIKANRSLKYGDVIKIIDAAKGAGASPMVLQIDDLAQ